MKKDSYKEKNILIWRFSKRHSLQIYFRNQA